MHTVYINLDRRPDRRAQFENECSRIGIEAERFPAISHTIPAIGCAMSHLAVLKLAREQGHESVCIFEDDFEFLVSSEEYDRILKALPAGFDVVMLGWYMFQTAPYDASFGRVLSGTTTSGYIVHRKFYDTLIANIEEAISLFQAHIRDYDVVARYSVDQYWKRIQPISNWFYTMKRVGKQRAGFSDIVGAQVAYDY
jgi:GR25 family glycosyltransferase involved in LPS biosynthesis